MSKINTTKNFALLYLSPVTGKVRVAGWYATTRAANISRTAKQKCCGLRYALYAAANVEAALVEGI